MSGVKGDFAGLRKLIDGMEALGDGTGGVLKGLLADNLAAETMKLIADGFRHERDPYGEHWAPLLHRHGKILRDTGRMAASANAHAAGDVIRGQISTGYASFHQDGAHHPPVSHAKPRVTYRNLVSNRFVRAPKRPNKNVAAFSTRHTAKEWDLKRRMMVPTKDRGLGPIWSAAFRKTTIRTVKRLAKASGIG